MYHLWAGLVIAYMKDKLRATSASCDVCGEEDEIGVGACVECGVSLFALSSLLCLRANRFVLCGAMVYIALPY